MKTLNEIKEELELIISSWNGKDDKFVADGVVYSEDAIDHAQEALTHLKAFKGSYENVGGVVKWDDTDSKGYIKWREAKIK